MRKRAEIDGSADIAVAETAALAEGEERAAEGDERAAEDERAAGGDTLVGLVLQDRYEVTAKIGQGGMGAVYEARHTVIGKRVAVKVLLDKYAEKDQVVARLKQEAKLASSIGHANIIDITDFGTTMDGRTFVVMEFLEGESLGACIQREGALDQQRVIRIGRQIASALGAAHKKGIVHRDIKPENVFLQRRGDKDFVKVVDFGISKSLRAEGDDSPRLTQTGMVLGTPLYMSPEQARGDEELDHRIDVYALGVILYEMVTGEMPFRGSNYLNILSQVISDEPPPPSTLRAELDRDLESVILKAMAKEAAERYQSMADLDADLAALEESETRTTGARITAARWRRQRERKLPWRYLAWGGGVTALAAAVAFAAASMVGGSGDPPVAQPVAAPPADAAPAAVPPPVETPPPEPAFETAVIDIVTDPPGARVFHKDRLVGISPTPFQVEKEARKIILRAELDGYRPAEIEVNPMLDHGRSVTASLDALERDVRRRKRRRKSSGDGPPPRRKRNGDGTGDLMDNPHRP